MKANALGVLCKLHRDESGQNLIEYAFAAALIGFGSIASMGGLASNINTAFSRIGSTVVSATTGQ